MLRYDAKTNLYYEVASRNEHAQKAEKAQRSSRRATTVALAEMAGSLAAVHPAIPLIAGTATIIYANAKSREQRKEEQLAALTSPSPVGK